MSPLMGIGFNCAVIPNTAACTCTQAAITCTVNVATLTNVGLTREWSYPLFNDSTPVPTTFEPKPLPTGP